MYETHPSVTAPEDEQQVIWRYIDFTKFVSMIDTRTLFFARPDKLEDKFEGSYPKTNLVLREKQYGDLPKEERTMRLQHISAINADFSMAPIFVNCWHMNNHESAAMWSLYTGVGNGVAIRSTFGRLASCFRRCTEDIYIGIVKYLDWDTESISEENFLHRWLHKRKSFEHEHELRALTGGYPERVWSEQLNQPAMDDDSKHLLLVKWTEHLEALEKQTAGLSLNADLDVLIDSILVSPSSPNWFTALVMSVLKKYSINKPVIQSRLADDPIY